MTCAKCERVGLYQVGDLAFCKVHHADALIATAEAARRVAARQAGATGTAQRIPGRNHQLYRFGSKGGYGRVR